MIGTEESREELSALGEDVDDFVVQKQSKLRKSIMDLTKVASNGYKGFDILDQNGNYKSFYERMQGLSDIYAEIQEQDKKLGNNSATALVELIAGKNRSDAASSVLSNPDLLHEAHEAAMNSDGSAQQELDNQLDTIDSKLQNLTNEAQQFWYSMVDSSTIKTIVDFLSNTLQLTTQLTEKLGLLGTIGLGAGMFAGIKNVGRGNRISSLSNIVYCLNMPTV